MSTTRIRYYLLVSPRVDLFLIPVLAVLFVALGAVLTDRYLLSAPVHRPAPVTVQVPGTPGLIAT